MKDTIKSKAGYRIRAGKNIHGEIIKIIYEGDNILFWAYPMNMSEYKYHKENNEAFNFCEVFTTRGGNQFIYWRDEEIDRDYITNVLS